MLNQRDEVLPVTQSLPSSLSPVAQSQSQSCGRPVGVPLPLEGMHWLQGSGLVCFSCKRLTLTGVRQSDQGLGWGQFPSARTVPCTQHCSRELFQEAQAPILGAIQTEEQNNGPQRCPRLNPRNLPRFFHGKTDFAEVIKVTDLEMGGLSRIIPAGSIQSHEFSKSESLLWLRSGSCDLSMT